MKTTKRRIYMDAQTRPMLSGLRLYQRLKFTLGRYYAHGCLIYFQQISSLEVRANESRSQSWHKVQSCQEGK